MEDPLETDAPDDPRLTESLDCSNDEEEINKITDPEIEEALKKCTSRAKGVDGYAQADLRALGRELNPVLLALFDNSLTSGLFPKQFLTNHNIFLHKK